MTNAAIIDGFSFTYPDGPDEPYYRADYSDIADYIEHLLGYKLPAPTACTPARYFRKRYTFHAETGQTIATISMFPVSPKAGNCVSVSIKGFACSSAAGSPQLDPVRIIKRVLHDANGHLTQIDMALDIYNRPDLLAQILKAADEAVHHDRIISPLRYKEPLTVNKRTVYFGKREQGKNSVCAYDKGYKHQTDYSWTRLEFRAGHRQLLDSIQMDIQLDRTVGHITKSLLATYLKFVPPGLKTKYQRPTCPWWIEVVGDGATYEMHRTAHPKDESEDRKRPKSVPSLAKVLATVESFLASDEGQLGSYRQQLLDEITDRLSR